MPRRMYSDHRRRQSERLREIYPDECYYCTRTFCGKKKRQRTIDHLFPISRGGTHDISNLVLCCYKCNNIKGARTWVEFYFSEDYRQRRASAFLERERDARRARRQAEVLDTLVPRRLVA